MLNLCKLIHSPNPNAFGSMRKKQFSSSSSSSSSDEGNVRESVHRSSSSSSSSSSSGEDRGATGRRHHAVLKKERPPSGGQRNVVASCEAQFDSSPAPEVHQVASTFFVDPDPEEVAAAAAQDGASIPPALEAVSSVSSPSFDPSSATPKSTSSSSSSSSERYAQVRDAYTAVVGDAAASVSAAEQSHTREFIDPSHTSVEDPSSRSYGPLGGGPFTGKGPLDSTDSESGSSSVSLNHPTVIASFQQSSSPKGERPLLSSSTTSDSATFDEVRKVFASIRMNADAHPLPAVATPCDGPMESTSSTSSTNSKERFAEVHAAFAVLQPQPAVEEKSLQTNDQEAAIKTIDQNIGAELPQQQQKNTTDEEQLKLIEKRRESDASLNSDERLVVAFEEVYDVIRGVMCDRRDEGKSEGASVVGPPWVDEGAATGDCCPLAERSSNCTAVVVPVDSDRITVIAQHEYQQRAEPATDRSLSASSSSPPAEAEPIPGPEIDTEPAPKAEPMSSSKGLDLCDRSSSSSVSPQPSSKASSRSSSSSSSSSSASTTPTKSSNISSEPWAPMGSTPKAEVKIVKASPAPLAIVSKATQKPTPKAVATVKARKAAPVATPRKSLVTQPAAASATKEGPRQSKSSPNVDVLQGVKTPVEVAVALDKNAQSSDSRGDRSEISKPNATEVRPPKLKSSPKKCRSKQRSSPRKRVDKTQVGESYSYGFESDATFKKLLKNPMFRHLNFQAKHIAATLKSESEIECRTPNDVPPADDSSPSPPQLLMTLDDCPTAMSPDGEGRSGQRIEGTHSNTIIEPPPCEPAQCDSPKIKRSFRGDSASPHSFRRTLSLSASKRRSDDSPMRNSVANSDSDCSNAKPPMNLRNTATDPVVFVYDALSDKHCASFLENNKVFQSHWDKMQVNLQPNHRVINEVNDASRPMSASMSKMSKTINLEGTMRSFRSAEVETERAKPCVDTKPVVVTAAGFWKQEKDDIPPLRDTACFGVPSGTSMDVGNSKTFFERRQQQLNKGMPVVMQNPNEMLVVQFEAQAKLKLTDPTAIKNPPSTSKRHRPPTAPTSTVARLPQAPNPAKPTPSWSRPASSRTLSSQRPSSSDSSYSFVRCNQLINPAARTPFLAGEQFTAFDAQYFPNSKAMQTSSPLPSPYHPQGKGCRKLLAAKSASDTSDEASCPNSPQDKVSKEIAVVQYSILTETRIGVLTKSEDYNRRQIAKQQSERFETIRKRFDEKLQFFVVRLKELTCVVVDERDQRDSIEAEYDELLQRMLQLKRRDRISAKHNEEVFPSCPVLKRGDSTEIPTAGEGSTIVDLRWSGELDSAVLMLMVFDTYDRFVTFVTNGESLRCPISGLPVVRSWGPFRFKSVHEKKVRPTSSSGDLRSLPTPPLGPSLPAFPGGRRGSLAQPAPAFANDGRSTFELLLHNLSPLASFNRFVFVAINPKKTGAPLATVFRTYLTVKQPLFPRAVDNLDGTASNFQGTLSDVTLSSTDGTQRSLISTAANRVQTDTKVREVSSVRLPDFPTSTCYVIASLVRQFRGPGAAVSPSSPSPLYPISPREQSLNGSDTPSSPPDLSRPSSATAHLLLTTPRPPSRAHSRLSSARSCTQLSVGALQSERPVPSDLTETCVWTFYCHDFCDPSIPNYHRLPQVLETSLFMDAGQTWYAALQGAFKIGRQSDEQFEKIFRSGYEMLEDLQRAELLELMQKEQKRVEEKIRMNPMVAVMARLRVEKPRKVTRKTSMIDLMKKKVRDVIAHRRSVVALEAPAN